MAAVIVLGLGVTTACSSERGSVDFADAAGEPVVADGGPSNASVLSSRAAFAASDIVVLTAADSVDELSDNSQEAHMPLLVADHLRSAAAVTSNVRAAGGRAIEVPGGDRHVGAPAARRRPDRLPRPSHGRPLRDTRHPGAGAAR